MIGRSSRIFVFFVLLIPLYSYRPASCQSLYPSLLTHIQIFLAFFPPSYSSFFVLLLLLCSRYLYHLGIAPEIEDLHGIAQFTEEEISAIDKELQKSGVQMPKFGKIGGILAKEVCGRVVNYGQPLSLFSVS
jgi:hypothetical protein